MTPAPSPIAADQSARRPSENHVWKWAVTIALAGALLYLALRGVEWKRVGAIIVHCRVRYLLLACSCGILAYIVRALRWRILLSAREKLAPATVLWASSVGYLANNYLPARAGELVRTVMISSRSQLSKAYVFTTAMTERVIELVVLVLMAWVGSLTVAHRPLWAGRLMLFVAVAAILATAFLLFLPKLDRARAGLIARLPVSQRVRLWLHEIAESVTLALISLRDPSRLFQVCAVTAIVWTLDASAAVIMAHALGMRLLFPVALLLSTGLALGNALPATPGAVGISQFVAVSVLMPFGFGQTDAIAFILVAQAGTYAVITLLGLIGLWRYRVAGDAQARNLS